MENMKRANNERGEILIKVTWTINVGFHLRTLKF